MIDLFRKAKKAYREGGFFLLLRRIYLKILRSGPVSSLIKRVFGKVFYEKLEMVVHIGYWPEIKEPESFNEKIAHRKFFTDKEIYSKISDKWKVREYVEERVGDEILNEVYYVTDDPETIPFEELPKKFVIKANHGSGWNIIVENKGEADFQHIKEKCENWLNNRFQPKKEEYWYSRIDPKIIVEKYIENNSEEDLKDYKFFVFNGETKYIQVDVDRHTDHKRIVYDSDWNSQEFEIKFPKASAVEKPYNLDEMMEVAENLGEAFDFIRVDLYNPMIDKVIFGELTVAHGSGRERFRPKKFDFKIGEYWES